MVAYSFKSRFAEPILAGTKRQTIRADRKRHARRGEEMQLYTGMRTRQCKLIARVTCAQVRPIGFHFNWVRLQTIIVIGDPPRERLIKGDDLEAFARKDGFESFAEMYHFWEKENDAGLQWFGVIITWKPISPVIQ